jgi:WD40 repeat protein
VKLSPNGRYIFSGGEDGTIFIFQVKNIDKNEFLEVLYPLQDPEDLEIYNDNFQYFTDNELADVMLVSKNDIKYYMDDQIK